MIFKINLHLFKKEYLNTYKYFTKVIHILNKTEIINI